ncbi:MAG: energy transducer TonB [Acidobacteria bacterium]|nr:energy transducer TonB [Acidobacteriota bacterium]
MFEQIDQIVREAIPSNTQRGLNYGIAGNGIDKTLTVTTYPAGQTFARNGAPSAGPILRVGGDVQASKLLQKVDPVYPPLARAARIQGVVVLDAVISATGQVSNLRSGSSRKSTTKPAGFARSTKSIP